MLFRSVDDEIAIGNARKHLRAGERDKHCVSSKQASHNKVLSARSGTDTRNDAGCAKQDEAAQNDRRTVSPIDPSGQHHKADSSDCDYRNDRSHSAKQRALQPVDRINNRARSSWISRDRGKGRA